MVIEAMATLRSNGYLHRDLKAENLLFNKFGQMVLGDIGNIKDLEGGASCREVGAKLHRPCASRARV
jgi:serine/threonine protein kinase